MKHILLVCAVLTLSWYMTMVWIKYTEIRKRHDKLGRAIFESKGALDSLHDRHRKRVEKSLFVLERHPDLRNVLGAPVTKRYADQIAAITQRYAKASENDSTRMTSLLEDGNSHSRALQAMEDEGSSRPDVLFEEGLGTIEHKIEKALALKGAEAKDELDVYVRFLQDAD